MISIQQKILDEFRMVRRQLEYEVLICELPRDIANIILDYSQLDEDVLDRARNVRIYLHEIYISSSLHYYGESDVDIVYTVYPRNRYALGVSKSFSYLSILLSCYNDRSSFARILAHEINYQTVESHTNHETLSAINETIVEYIRWPNDFWLSG